MFIVTTRHPCLLDEHHSLCEQAIQCHFAVYYTSVTAVGYTERCDEGVRSYFIMICYLRANIRHFS